jgi:hypothetical protein
MLISKMDGDLTSGVFIFLGKKLLHEDHLKIGDLY